MPRKCIDLKIHLGCRTCFDGSAPSVTRCRGGSRQARSSYATPVLQLMTPFIVHPTRPELSPPIHVKSAAALPRQATSETVRRTKLLNHRGRIVKKWPRALLTCTQFLTFAIQQPFPLSRQAYCLHTKAQHSTAQRTRVFSSSTTRSIIGRPNQSGAGAFRHRNAPAFDLHCARKKTCILI